MEGIYQAVQKFAAILEGFNRWVTYPITLVSYFTDCIRNCPKPPIHEPKVDNKNTESNS